LVSIVYDFVFGNSGQHVVEGGAHPFYIWDLQRVPSF